MPHGAPDWSNVVKYYQVHRLDDMAELAARLGAIHRWDRRGDVLFFDDFSNGLNHWIIVSLIPTTEPVITTETAEYGGLSVKFTPSDGADNYHAIWKPIAYPHPSPLGFEFSVALGANILYIDSIVRLHLPTGNYEFIIRYNHQYHEVLYLDETGTWKEIWTDFYFALGYELFHHFKYVIDTEECEYVRLIMDSKQTSLKGIKGYPLVEKEPEYLEWGIKISAQVGETITAYVDNCIITMNEPGG